MTAARHLNPFRDTVALYRKAGWFGTLPLPYKQKHPPPTGFTGLKADHPTPDDIATWCQDGKRHNMCVRLAGVTEEYEVIGIDVDHYRSGDKDKKGGDQLAELEKQFGPLPATWVSSARTDGFSGIRYFLVPRGFEFRERAHKDIEVIQKKHRFAVVWPSIHTEGGTYYWFPPGASLDADGRLLWNGEIPIAKDLPLLPKKWFEFLTQGGMKASDSRIDMDSSVNEIYQWADDTFHGDSNTLMCHRMAEKVEVAKKKICDEATSHDKIVLGHMNILHLASEGHVGWNAAFNEIEAFWAEDVVKRDKRSMSEVSGEVWRSRVNGLRKIKAKIDERVKIGAAGIQRRCDEPGGECCVSVDSSGDPDDPLGDVPHGVIKPVGEYRLNDDGNADHFVDMYSSIQIGPSVRFAEAYGWIVWHTGISGGTQPRWQRDENGDQEVRRMFQRVRDRQEDYVENALKPDMMTKIIAFMNQTPGTSKADVEAAKAKYQEWKKFSVNSGNNRNADSALTAVHSVSGVSIDVNDLDQNPYLLGVKNGVVVLDGEDVSLRMAHPEDYITLNTNVAWEEPSSRAVDVWQDYLDTFIPEPELQKALQIALGHCIIGGNPEKIMLVLWGPPNTGKSTLITAIQTALGDYCETVNQSMFQNHKLNPILADALNKRVIVCSEFDEHDQLSASMIKRMTGGHDEIRAEKKGSNVKFSGIPQFVMILATNEVPSIPGTDKALENRLYPIPFNSVPARIRKETANVVKAICGPAVLNWLIDGYVEYRRIGGLPMPVGVANAKREFVAQLDEIATFANEMIQEATEPVYYVSRKKMYEAFERWWIANKYPVKLQPSMNKFKRRMSALGLTSPHGQLRIDGSKDYFWVGVKLRRVGVVHDMKGLAGRTRTESETEPK